MLFALCGIQQLSTVNKLGISLVLLNQDQLIPGISRGREGVTAKERMLGWVPGRISPDYLRLSLKLL